MIFVIRKKDFLIVDKSEPDDIILAYTDNENFKKYVEDIKQICGPYSDCKFPESYFGNIRPWDYEQVLDYGNFEESHKVLECGGLHSYFAIYLAQKVQHYTCTDSFYWATRDYAKNDRLQSPQEWCEYLIAKGKGKLHAEEADLQNLQYPDNSFDRVVNISVIEHVHKDRQGIEEMMRVLKPGGTLLLTTEYNANWSKSYSETDDSYYRVYDEDGIKELFHGLNVDMVKVQSTDVPVGRFTTMFLRIIK